MSTLAHAIVFGLLVLFLTQYLFLWAFLRVLRSNTAIGALGEPMPKVAVILSVRGPDPTLPDCILGLFQQRYPDFEIIIVLDDPHDPAADVLRELIRTRKSVNVRLHVLARRLRTCSLKCSSIVEALQYIKPDAEIVALIDADTVPHPNWLSDLVRPLRNKSVGATTGNRWYLPDAVGLPSMLRYLWNAAAVVQMYAYEIPWGGSLALRVETIRKAGLISKWSHALCDDTPLYSALRQQGLRVHFVPSLMMLNSETCRFVAFLSWIRRQLLLVRLYHPLWPFVFAHGILVSLFPTIVGIYVVFGIVQLDFGLAIELGIGLAAYQLAMSMFCLLPLNDRIAGTILRNNGVAIPRPSVARSILGAIILQLVYWPILILVNFAKLVTWRQIRYRLGGAWDIEMLGYQPFKSSSGKGHPANSDPNSL